MEIHWNGAKLIDAGTMLEWAKSMTWKGVHPVVEISRKVYEKWLERDGSLPKWDIMIHPAGSV